MGKMKWRKTIIFLMIAIFLFSIAAVSASDVDDMEIASEDANQIELSASNEMNVDNLKTSEENTIETQAKNNKSMSAALGSKLLDTDTGTFSGLYSEIGSGGNIELQHDYYTYDWGRTIEITLDNTVAYTFDIQKHNINVVAGQSIEKNTYGENLNAAGNNLLFGDSWEHAYVGNAQILKLADLTSIGGSPSGDNSLASFFGRVSYNYDEKYMFQATLRADGSSNFARGHRWGVFPSVSAGWVLTNEKFMEKTKSWLDFFKIRASWGQNGNCNIPNFQYLTQVGFSTANSYFYGLTSPGTPGLANHEEQTTGGSFNVLGNPELTWETSEQIDLGIDARFLGGRLGFVFDWYKKTTKDWLVRAPILGVYGIGAPYINGGDVKNTGIEVALNWNDNLKCGLRYGASINLSYNKNEVTKLANAEGIMHNVIL